MAKDMSAYLAQMEGGKPSDDASTDSDGVPGDDSAGMNAHDCIHMLEHGSTPDGKHKIHPDDHAMMKRHMEPMYQSMHDALDENGSEYESDDGDEGGGESYNHHEDNEE